MTVNAQGRKKRPLRVVLATATLVGLYLLATVGVSGVAMTVGSGPAHAKKKGGSGGGSKGSKGDRGGRRGGRGRRGRGRGCSVPLQILDLC
jgi:hypothetical protein